MQFIQLRSMSFVAVLVLLSVLMVSFVVFQNENDHNSVSRHGANVIDYEEA